MSQGRWIVTWAAGSLLMCCVRQGAAFAVAGQPLDLEPRVVEPLEFESQFDEEAEEEEIETDRDSFTPATTTAPLDRAIVESAYSFIDNKGVPETHSFPELLVRYGASDWLELRLGWNYEIGGAPSPISGNVPGEVGEHAEVEEEHRLLYGIKLGLTEQCGCRPQSAAIIQFFTPTGGESTDTELSATYVFGWELANRWVWDSGIRYSTSAAEEDEFGVWAPSTVLKIPVGERWKIHAEYFGVFSSGREEESRQHYFSPGAHYLITPSLEIGVRVGWGLSQDSANFFANAGFGWMY